MAAATSPLPDMPWKKPSPSSKFVAVAEVASLAPGQGRTVSAAGAELALYNLGGEFFAIADRCPHRGGTLGAGYLDADGHLFCPLHGWKFDLRSGACLSRPDRPVARYATRVRDGRIEVEL
jgi:nitrite reductase/ring-hydroxylating ferredoxin subunit